MNNLNSIVGTIRTTIGITSLLCCLAGFSGCAEMDGPVTRDNEATVTLRLDEALQEMAFVRLNHNGGQDDFWVWFVTTDMMEDPEILMDQHLAKDLEDDGEILGNQGTNKNLTIENLQARTSYRVIAARIHAHGVVAGNVAELVFTTLRDPDVFEAHPQWKIEYKERRVAKDDPDEESEVFTCTIADTTDTYIPVLLSKSDFEKSYGGNVRACFDDYVAFRNMEHVKWPNVVISKSTEHVEDRLRSGDYIAFMIGITPSGELTGYYARVDFTVSQETATAAYRKWLGGWTIIGLNGDTEIRYSVEITPEENNLYYRMTGWESTSANGYFATVPVELPILLYFEKSSGDAYVVSEELPDLADETYASFYDFYLYGCVKIDYDGVMTDVPVDAPNLKIARFGYVNDSYAKVTPEIFTFDLNGVYYEEPFIYFNYSYISQLYNGLIPVTVDAKVPRISTMRLER